MIIFDLDGTLWDTLDATYEGANKIAAKMKIDPISKEQVTSGMGMSFSDIAKHYMPKLDKETREQFMLKYMMELMK